MKKVLIICLCQIILLCISCSKIEGSSEKNSSICLKNRIASSEELYPSIDIEKKLWMNENNCKVYIPWIVDEKYIDVNNKIESFLRERIDGVTETGWDDSFYINIDYVISYNQNQILSFYFLEKSFIGWRSHESLTGINIDMQSGESIPITDLVDINEIFLEKLFSYRSDKYGREEYISSYLEENYGKDEIIEMVKNEIGVSYYFSKDFIYVSFPLTQTLSFHMEFGVKWQGQKDLNPLYIRLFFACISGSLSPDYGTV